MEKGCLLWNLPIYPHTTTSYFHFRYDVLPRHIVSVCLFHRLGLCFPQVCQSQGPCFKFIISCLKDEKPICLRGVWKAPQRRHDRMSCSEMPTHSPECALFVCVCVCVCVCLSTRQETAVWIRGQVLIVWQCLCVCVCVCVYVCV